MSLPLLRTLGDIRAEIQTRLGFGMAGQAGVVNSPLIDSFIRSAQAQLVEQFPWLRLKGVDERSTGADQQYYDYPDDCDAGNLTSVSVYWGGQCIPLHEGIDVQDRGLNVANRPLKYERREQIEIWPVPSNDSYTLRFEYNKIVGELVDSSDRVSMPSELVFLHALANAKAHYRQPDATTYSSQLDSLIVKLKQRQRSRTIYGKRRGEADPHSYADSTQDV
jgi:hypothetical protein